MIIIISIIIIITMKISDYDNFRDTNSDSVNDNDNNNQNMLYHQPVLSANRTMNTLIDSTCSVHMRVLLRRISPNLLLLLFFYVNV